MWFHRSVYYHSDTDQFSDTEQLSQDAKIIKSNCVTYLAQYSSAFLQKPIIPGTWIGVFGQDDVLDTH